MFTLAMVCFRRCKGFCLFLYFFENRCFLCSHCVRMWLDYNYRGEDLKDELKEHAGSDDKRSYRTELEKRKRVNRMKTAIIVIIIILIILPTVLCIILGIQVKRLQKNVDDLMEIHGKFEQSLQTTKEKEGYAYAAERPITDVRPLPFEEVNNENGESTGKEISDSDYDEDGKKNQDTYNRKEHNADTSSKSDEEKMNDPNPDTEKPNETDQDNEKSKNPKQDEEKSKNIDKNAEEKKKLSDKDKKAKKGIYKGKKVYLTFDDGPSKYTNDILDILAEYDVKATFFVIGKTDEESKNLYQRIVEEGHTLGMHSYSHDYSKIYNSVEDFDKDFTKLWNLLYDIIGYRPKIYRFPGGSANQVNENGMEDFIRYLNKKSVTYYDWNVENKDATGVEYTKEQLVDNVLKTMTGKTICVVLMHDSSKKKSTVDSLPVLIETLISGDAQLLPLDETVSPIQQIKADSIE